MTALRCGVCGEEPTQRVVTPDMIKFRCRRHSFTKKTAMPSWTLVALEPAKKSVVRSALRPDCDDATSTCRNTAVRSATKETAMASTKEATKTPTAPKPGRGFTVVELRTPHQSDIVKASSKGLPAGSLKFEDRWVVVKNENAQAVVDKVNGNAGDVGIFDRRVLDYFTAVILLGNDKLTDTRSSLHARLIQVGRGKPGFRFEMKQDGTLLVHVGNKALGTQKEAMTALDPSQLKAPARTGGSSANGGSSSKPNLHEKHEAAKAERKALKAWEAADEATRGPRPSTDTYDAMQVEYDRKEASKAKDAEERRAAEAAAPVKSAAKKQVTSRLKNNVKKAS